jgi:hypothetical protein
MSVRRRGNGLTADSYVRLLDVDPRLADHLLVALASANVAAYTTPATGRTSPTLELHLPSRPMEVVHVDSTRRPAARRVLEATMPDMTVGMPTVEEEDEFAALVAAWDEVPASAAWPAAEDTDPSGVDVTKPPRRRRSDPRPVEPDVEEPSEATGSDPGSDTGSDTAQQDASDLSAAATEDKPAAESPEADMTPDTSPDSDRDTDAAPRSRVIRWSGPSLEKASAEAGDKRHQEPGDNGDDSDDSDDSDPDSVAEDHYVPPPLPPMPPAHPVTKWGIVALLLGLVLLIAPTLLGLEHTTPVNLVGVLSILGGVGLLVSRLSDRSSDDYEGPDDGAVV